MTSTPHVPRIRWRRPPSAPVRLTALITGASSTEAAHECIESLRNEWARDLRKAEDLDVIVVDGDAGCIHPCTLHEYSPNIEFIQTYGG